MLKIIDLAIIKKLDNKGLPALSVTIKCDNGITAEASTSIEPHSITVENDISNNEQSLAEQKYYKILEFIENFAKPKVIGFDISNQQAFDQLLLKIPAEENNINSNLLIAFSLSASRANSAKLNLPLYKYLQQIVETKDLKIPTPAFTVLENSLNTIHSSVFKEFLVIPATSKTFQESLELGLKLHPVIKTVIIKNNLQPLLGIKGGYSPLLNSNEEGLNIIKDAIDSMNIRLGYDVFIGLDCSAGNFYLDKYYNLSDKKINLNNYELINFYKELIEKYHILYLEDPLALEDYEGWHSLYEILNQHCIISSDNLTSMDTLKLQNALLKSTINATVVKPFLSSTITEALAYSAVAKVAGLKTIVSSSNTETNDDFLADFAVAVKADYVSFGGTVHGERVAEYNRLLKIENELQMK